MHTKYSWDELVETKVMGDHQDSVFLFCPCGSTIPQDTVPRCWLCKRRHRPEQEWVDEFEGLRANTPPYVDGEGTYPRYTAGYELDITWNGYPKLKYQGPIYQYIDKADGAVGEGNDEIVATDPPPSFITKEIGPGDTKRLLLPSNRRRLGI